MGTSGARCLRLLGALCNGEVGRPPTSRRHVSLTWRPADRAGRPPRGHDSPVLGSERPTR